MKSMLACAAALMIATPAMAQDVETVEAVPADSADATLAEGEFEEDASANPFGDPQAALAMVQALFAAPELTAEQETRLPLATQLAERLLPDGIYARAMTETFSSIIEPMMGFAPTSMPIYSMSEKLGVDFTTITELDEAQQQEIGRILDPGFEQRSKVMVDFAMAKMTEMMALVEPGLRRGIARSFATRLDEQQLTAVAAFFATPEGAAFAEHSLLAFSDRQAISGLMTELPKLMEALPGLETGMKEAEAALPPERQYADLTSNDRKRLAKLLGISEAELEKSMADAAATRAAIEAGTYDWEAEELEAESEVYQEEPAEI